MGLTVHFEVLNQLGTPMMYSSSLATRPAAGIQGRIFFRTDSPFGIYRDNGTTWDLVSGSGGGGIGGSGTATQIAYFSGPTTLASSANLFWDNTNSRLGINTNTPGSSLDIHSSVQSVIQANNTTLGNSFLSFQLQGTGKWQIGNVYNAGDNYFRIQDQLNTLERLTIRNTGQIDFLGYTQILNTVTGITGTTPSALPNNYYSNNFTYNSGITTVASVNTIGLDVDNSLNYSGANTINNTSYNTSSLLRNILTFGSSGASITYTQATGIRALVNNQVQYFQSGANNGTISHYANIQILGDNKNGAGLTTFSNRYGLLINDFNEFTAGNTYTNRWGIYQAGLNESNFFGGKVGIGSGYTPSTFQLDVQGTARISGSLEITAGSVLKFSDNRVQIGNGSLTANFGVAIGFNSTTNGQEGTAVGNSAATNNAFGTSIGRLTSTIDGVSIGGSSTSQNGIAIKGVSTGIGITIGGIAGNGGLSICSNSNATTANGIAIGVNTTAGFDPSIAIGVFATATAKNQFVIGGNNASNLYAINDVYIGGGVQDLNANNGNSVVINASGGANAPNKNGGNITIAGGKGTGTGTSGDVIFSTSTPLGSGSTLQSLTSRWFVKGSTGCLTNEVSPNASAILSISSSSQGFLPPRMTTIQKNAIATPATGLLIYDTTLNKLCVYTTNWETVTSI